MTPSLHRLFGWVSAHVRSARLPCTAARCLSEQRGTRHDGRERLLQKERGEPTDKPGQAITEREALAREIEWRERRRAVGVKLSVLVGALLLAAGLTVYILTGASATGQTSPLALLLMAAGLLVAFPLAALLALLLGPTWPQRQRHIELTRRETNQ